jgi:replicative DNA helicase
MPINTNKNRSSRQQPIDNTYAKAQPQALEVERAVLGALMIDKDAYAQVCETLKPECFYEPRNQQVYLAITELSKSGSPIDIWTVTEQLARQDVLEEVGGPGYIAELSSKVASSANIEYHAKIVVQKWVDRKLIALAVDLQNKGFDQTIDSEDKMNAADEALLAIRQSQKDNETKTLGETTKEAYKEIDAASAKPNDITGVASFHSLDNFTAGYQPSDLIIVAARPAMGKTSFALTTAKKISLDQNIPTAFFSLEMSAVELTKRLISNVCEIPGNALLKGNLNQSEWERLDKNVNWLVQAPLYIDETPGLNIGTFRAKAKRLVKEKAVKIIFLDYLQLMRSEGKRYSTRQEEVGDISRSLKAIAKELQIPIVALSQLNRGVESRQGLEGKRPQLSDLRESGAIEQDADLVMFVHRPEYYHIYTDDNGRDLHGMAQIIIAKHRKGSTGDVLLTFRGEFTRFEDEDEYSITPKSQASSTSVEDTTETIVESKMGNAFSSDEDCGPLPF